MIIKYKLGDPHTTWWSNNANRTRQEVLIGFTRTYFRDERVYLYRFIFFRFTIGIIL